MSLINSKHSCIFLIGTYVCSKCDHELFGSQSKYKHETPWPAFSQTKHENSLSKRLESKGAFKVRKKIQTYFHPFFVCVCVFYSLAFLKLLFTWLHYIFHVLFLFCTLLWLTLLMFLLFQNSLSVFVFKVYMFVVNVITLCSRHILSMNTRHPGLLLQIL